MTNKTLDKKIALFKQVKASIDELEHTKKELSKAIAEEFKARNEDKYNGLRLVCYERETLSKNSGIPTIVWDRYKTVTPVEQLRTCK